MVANMLKVPNTIKYMLEVPKKKVTDILKKPNIVTDMLKVPKMVAVIFKVPNMVTDILKLPNMVTVTADVTTVAISVSSASFPFLLTSTDLNWRVDRAGRRRI